MAPYPVLLRVDPHGCAAGGGVGRGLHALCVNLGSLAFGVAIAEGNDELGFNARDSQKDEIVFSEPIAADGNDALGLVGTLEALPAISPRSEPPAIDSLSFVLAVTREAEPK